MSKRRRAQPGVLLEQRGVDPAELQQRRRDAGFSLLQTMLSLFASQKIGACDLCVLRHWANEAGVPG
eukprot:4871889-Pyramimonas_sp.AAC.1